MALTVALLTTLLAPTAHADDGNGGFCARVNPDAPNQRLTYAMTSELADQSLSDVVEVPADAHLDVNEVLDAGDLAWLNVAAKATTATQTASNGTASVAGAWRFSNVTEFNPTEGEGDFTDKATSVYELFLEVGGPGAVLDPFADIGTDVHVDSGDVADGPLVVELSITETDADGVTPLPGGFTTTLVSDDGETDIDQLVALPPGNFAMSLSITVSGFGTVVPSTGGDGMAAIILYYSQWGIDCTDAAPSCASSPPGAERTFEWSLINELTEVDNSGVRTFDVVPDTRNRFVRTRGSQKVGIQALTTETTATNNGASLAGTAKLLSIASAAPEEGNDAFVNGARGSYEFHFEVDGDNAMLNLDLPVAVQQRQNGEMPDGQYNVSVVVSDANGVVYSELVTPSSSTFDLPLDVGSWTVKLTMVASQSGPADMAAGSDGRVRVFGPTWQWAIDCTP